MNFRKDNNLPYTEWIEEAHYNVIAKALAHAAEYGLPGNHHFYITFATHAPGVTIPDFLKARYQDVMTIVLQHQFSELSCISIPQPGFTVELTFSGRISKLVIPFKAIVAFADPEAHLEFQFSVPLSATNTEEDHTNETLLFPQTNKVEDLEVSAGTKISKDDKKASIISLDRFRKKNPTED